jgi:hypothetical protein
MQPAARGPRLLLAIVQHDAAIVALILLLYAAGSAAARWDNRVRAARAAATIIVRLCKALCLLVVLLYVADVFVYHFFVTRLYIGDIVTFASEPRAALSLLRSGWRVISGHHPWKLAIGAVLAVLLLRACYVFLAKPLRSPLRSRLLAVAAMPLAALAVVPVPGYFYSFHDQALYENFVERNEIRPDPSATASTFAPCTSGTRAAIAALTILIPSAPGPRCAIICAHPTGRTSPRRLSPSITTVLNSAAS